MSLSFKKFCLAGLILSCLFLFCACSNNNELELSVIHTNDMHGRILFNESKNQIGLSKLKSYMDQMPRKNILLVDAGDTFHGKAIINMSHGQDVSELMNLLGYDYMCPGNHDFEFGVDELVKRSHEGKFKVLAANIFYEQSDKLLFNAHDLIEIGNFKIGIFGLTTPETKSKSGAKNTQGIIFKEPILIAKEQVSQLKDLGADFIIAITHLGIDQESEPERSYDLRDKLGNDLDLIIDGHSHSILPKINQDTNNKACITSAGAYLENIGRVDIKITKPKLFGETKKVIKPQNILFEQVKNQQDNHEINSRLENLKNKTIDYLNQIMGYTKLELPKEIIIAETQIDLSAKKSEVRTRETLLTKIATDAIRFDTGADVSIINGGGFRDSIKAGDITLEDIFNVFPFGDYILLKSLTGREIIQALEFGVDQYPAHSTKFPQVSGLSCVLDPEQSSGSRITHVCVNNKPIDLNKNYSVAMGDFLAHGGDDYEIFERAKEIGQSGIDFEIIANYFKKISPIEQDDLPARIIIKNQ